MHRSVGVSAEEALSRLSDGNKLFIHTGLDNGDYSGARRIYTAETGQNPYAVVISCSDSRVIPEAVFSAGIGDLFVIRTAGNTVDTATMGSVEYAVEHLGCNLIVVMGHTRCGAISSALGKIQGYKVQSILDYIHDAASGETDCARVTELNVMKSVAMLKDDLRLHEDVRVVGAIYDTREGTVEFLRAQ